MTKKRYPPLYSKKELEDIALDISKNLAFYIVRLEKKQEILFELLREKGEDEFIFWLARVLGERKQEFAPTPRLYPELKKRLDALKNTGYLTDGIRVGRSGDFWETPTLRIELPLNADLKGYLKAMLVYQEFIQSLENDNKFVEYLVQEHGEGRTYNELAKEMNEALSSWANGETTRLELFGFDEFLRKQGYTPETFKLYQEPTEEFDDESVRSKVRYFWEKRKGKDKDVK